MNEEISKTKEIVAFYRLQDFGKLALIDDQILEFLISPVICSHDALSEILVVDVDFHILLNLFMEGVRVKSGAKFDDIKVLSCD